MERLGSLRGMKLARPAGLLLLASLFLVGCGEVASEADYDALGEAALPEARAFALTHATLTHTLEELRDFRREAQAQAQGLREELSPSPEEVESFEQLATGEQEATARHYLQYVARIDAAEEFLEAGRELLPRWDEATAELNRRQHRDGLHADHFASHTAAGKVHARTQELLERIEAWKPPQANDDESLRAIFESFRDSGRAS